MPTKRTIAQDVLDHLVSAERNNDLAIVSSAQLAAALLKSRLEMDCAINIGHDVIERVATSLVAQVESRRRFVAAHAELAEIKDAIGLRTVAVGGGGRKKVEEFIFGAELKLVETAAA